MSETSKLWRPLTDAEIDALDQQVQVDKWLDKPFAQALIAELREARVVARYYLWAHAGATAWDEGHAQSVKEHPWLEE